jgi:hypothetical protein
MGQETLSRYRALEPSPRDRRYLILSFKSSIKVERVGYWPQKHDFIDTARPVDITEHQEYTL